MSEPTEQQIEAVAWKRALDCAARQFENYYRADMLADPAQRRVALDDALQHAVGILSLAAAPRQAEGWQKAHEQIRDSDFGGHDAPLAIFHGQLSAKRLASANVVLGEPSKGRPMPMCNNNGWMDIQTAPKDGRLLLLYCDGEREMYIAHYVIPIAPGGKFGPFIWKTQGSGGVAEKIPTHWMPLPEPPR